MATDAAPQPLTGECFCGGIKFEVDTDAPVLTTLLCHCSCCRRAHAAPVYQVVYVPPESLRIVSGAELVKPYAKGRGPTRSFCAECGTRVTITPPGPMATMMLGWFPNLLDDASTRAMPSRFHPNHHTNYPFRMRCLDWDKLEDGLPRTYPHESYELGTVGLMEHVKDDPMKKAMLDQMLAFLEGIKEVSRQAKAAGKTVDEAYAAVDEWKATRMAMAAAAAAAGAPPGK